MKFHHHNRFRQYVTSSLVSLGLALLSIAIPSTASAEMYLGKRDFAKTASATTPVTFSTTITVDRYGNRSPVRFTDNIPASSGITASYSPNPMNYPTSSGRVTFTIAPNAPGGTTNFNVTATMGTSVSVQPVSIAVTAAPVSRITLSPTSVTFGPLSINQTPTPQTVTITNTGTANLTISAVNLSGADASSFSVSSNACAGATVLPNRTCTFAISALAPTVIKTYSAQINFTCNATTPPTLPISMIAVQAPSYEWYMDQRDFNMNQNSTVSTGMEISRYTGWTGSVAFSFVNMPAGLTGNISENPMASDRGSITFRTTSTIAPGSYNFIVRATAGTLVRDQPVSIDVVAATSSGGSSGATNTGGSSATGGTSGSGGSTLSSFSISSPSSISIQQGQSSSLAITINRSNFTNAVSMALVNAPIGVDASFNPASTTGGSSDLRLIVGSGVGTGSYAMTVRGTSGSVTQTANLTLNITAAPVSTGGSSGATSGSGGSSGTGGSGSTTGASTMKAFPEAVGFGAYARGGRGGDVCIVTNLSTSGSGSFQNCIDTASGPRTIVFKVSGLINSDINMNGKSNITIAGQTSPHGIIVRGFVTDEIGAGWCDQDEACLNRATKSSGLIVRHIRSRPNNGVEGDAFRLRALRNSILDHVSAEEASDEAMEISYTSNVTIQNAILGETLGGHQWNGMLVNYSAPRIGLPLDRLSIVYTTFNKLLARYPELSRESPYAHEDAMDIEIINNLYWDQNWAMDISNINPFTGQYLSYNLNMIGNYSVTRASYPYGFFDMHMNDHVVDTTRAYVFDNHIEKYPQISDWALQYCCNDFIQSAPYQVNRIPSYGVATANQFTGAYVPPTLFSAATVERHIFQNAGAFPRDTLDTRIMSPICSSIIDLTAPNTNPYGDAFSISSNVTDSPTDTDMDGMPDTWERDNRLDPNTADNNGTDLSLDGYTNLEVYLNELANEVVHVDSTSCSF